MDKLDLKRIYAVCAKEFIHIKRDPRSLAITLLAPVVLLVLYAYAITFDIKKIDFAVVDRDNTSYSRSLIFKFLSSGYFELNMESYNNMEKSIEELRINKVRMILIIPEKFSSDLKKGKSTALQLIIDGSDANTANVAMGYAKIIVATFSRNVILKFAGKKGIVPDRIPGVEPVPRVWYNPELKSVNFIIPGLIAIIMMLIAAMLTSLTVVREKERGTFEQLISTPVKSMELMIGKLTPYVLIGIIDVFIIVVVGLLWFKVPFRGSFITFLIFTMLFMFCSMGLGLFMSSIAKTQTVAVIGTVFATMLPSILLSGFIFPIDSMPAAIRIFTYLVPARYFLTALRSLFLKADTGIAVFYPEALFLLFFGLLFLFLSAKNFKKRID